MAKRKTGKTVSAPVEEDAAAVELIPEKRGGRKRKGACRGAQQRPLILPVEVLGCVLLMAGGTP